MTRRLFVLIGILMTALLLAACAPQNAETPAPTLPPVTIQDFPTPTAIPVTPQGEIVTVGFNVRGWT